MKAILKRIGYSKTKDAGQHFDIYLIDSDNSIRNKLAYVFKTLPRYLYIKNLDKIFTQEKPKIQVENILDVIEDDAFEGLDSFYNFYEYTNKKWNLNKDELFKLWLSNKHDDIKGISDAGGIAPIIIILEQHFKEDFSDVNFIKKELLDKLLKLVITHGNKLRAEIFDEIKRFRNKEKDLIGEMQKFQKISGIELTDFELEKTEFALTLPTMDILEFFDLINLNLNVPFASVRNLYKIYKDFIPFNSWTMSLKNVINIKVSNVDESMEDKILEKKFSKSLVYYDDVKNKLIMTIEIIAGVNNIDRKKMIERVQSAIVEPLDIKSQDQLYITGVFYFPNAFFNKYVFSDLCMNDPLFSMLLKIDESSKASKKKQSIYVHFMDPREEKITLKANITEKIMARSDPLMKKKSLTLFPIGERYIRIKISNAKNNEEIHRFINILSKLFEMYKAKYDKIVSFYQEYIPNFGKEKFEPVKEDRVLQLKDQVPDLFLPGYTRKCTNQPRITYDKRREEERGYQVMEFPKTKEEGQQHFYVCDKREKYIFPGVRDNNLENKDKYQYIPCCFSTNQLENKKYKAYFEEEEIDDNEDCNKRILLTNKILKTDCFGQLPRNIQKIFDSTNPSLAYYRKGVSRTVNSFIECIVDALNIPFEERNISQFLQNIRKDIAKQSVEISRQENYNLSIQDIKNNIKILDAYFDPKLYIKLVEKYYKCNIILFTKNKYYYNGVILIPNHIKGYFTYKHKYKTTILVYEHMGSESDHAKYPQCEIICSFDKNIEDNKTRLFFSSNNVIQKQFINNIMKIFNNFSQCYNLNNFVTDLNIPKFDYVSQAIDTYGKTRFIQIKLDENNVNILTSPLPPLSVKELDKNNFLVKVDIKVALAVFKKYDIIIIRQTVVNGKCTEIIGQFKKVLFIISVNEVNPLKDIKQSNDINIISVEQSDLTIFNNNKKYARYLTEYFLWYFSDYVKDEDQPDINKLVRKFIRKKIRLIKNYPYRNLPKIFNKQNVILDKDKINIGGEDPEETLRRLVYVLSIRLERNKQRLLDYHNETVMYNYYKDITDFQAYNHQVLLEGSDSVMKWISEKGSINNLYKSIQVGLRQSYFIKNPILTNNVIMLAQNISSLDEGLYKDFVWDKLRYNIQEEESMSLSREGYDLYVYKNSNDISLHEINGGDQSRKIVGYKINGKPYFTSILKM